MLVVVLRGVLCRVLVQSCVSDKLIAVLSSASLPQYFLSVVISRKAVGVLSLFNCSLSLFMAFKVGVMETVTGRICRQVSGSPASQ